MMSPIFSRGTRGSPVDAAPYAHGWIAGHYHTQTIKRHKRIRLNNINQSAHLRSIRCFAMHALIRTKHRACMKNHFLFCCSIAFIKFRRRNLREHQQPVSKTPILKAEDQYTKRARDCSSGEIARRRIKLRNGVEKTSIVRKGGGR